MKRRLLRAWSFWCFDVRVGIITFHFVNNFGGALQAYALRRTVEEECECEAELIDYRNWFIRLCDRVRLLPITTDRGEFFSGLQTMRDRIARRNRFGLFTRDNNKLSRKYLNHWQLNHNPPGDDKYICGSDQIWNPYLTMGVSTNYFLCFEKNTENRISYAPSFGTDSFGYAFERRMRKYLKDIRYLSVREKSGQDLIKRATGRDAVRLIDPTFLLKKAEWSEIGRNPLASKEPYILLYIMQRDMEVYDYVKSIKEKKGLRVVEISRYGYNPGFVDVTLVDVGPAEFLGLFRDAAFVCTNSYHGLAYSIIFEKEFFLMRCKRFRARINNMLDLLHIDLPDGESEWESLAASYDKDYVRGIIQEERDKAILYLKNSIGVIS